MENNDQYKGINISGNSGDVIGVEVGGNNNLIGKNIVLGSGTTSIRDEMSKKSSSKYSASLNEFAIKINSQLQGQKISEEEKKAINNDINELAKAVKETNIVEGKNNEPTRAKKRELNEKLGTVIKTVLRIFPTDAKMGLSLFAPLFPFADLIGEKVEDMVNDYLQG